MSAFAVLALLARHVLKSRWINYVAKESARRSDVHIYSSVSYLRRNRLRRTCRFALFWEVLLLGVHPIPFVDFEFTLSLHETATSAEFVETTYLFSEMLFVLMFLRLVLVIRNVFNFSVYTDALSKRVW